MREYAERSPVLGTAADIPHHGALYLRLVAIPHGTGLISFKPPFSMASGQHLQPIAALA
jgi:hypothetical protein